MKFPSTRLTLRTLLSLILVTTTGHVMSSRALEDQIGQPPLKPDNMERDNRKEAARQEYREVIEDLQDEYPSLGLLSLVRRELEEGFAQYILTLRVGRGVHDVIQLHRVIKEQEAWQPVRSRRGAFLVHGDLFGFEAAFLSQELTNAFTENRSFAVTLAGLGLDIWGINLRWANVPADTADLTFMKDWKLQTHIDDLELGLAFARLTRLETADSFNRLNLLGWSRGAVIALAYANANAKSQLRRQLRHIKGLVLVDVAYKFAPEAEAERQDACQSQLLQQALFDSGIFFTDQGLLAATVGTRAKFAPTDTSPFIVGLSNRQAGLFVGGATFEIFAPAPPPVPFYHFTGARFDEFGLPSKLRFTDENRFFQFLQLAAPFQSLKELIETNELLCNQIDSPHDDHLAKVTLPTLYVGAAGGFGTFGIHTVTLLGSRDVNVMVVSLLPAEARIADFGHIDLWLAADAKQLVWQPISRWLVTH